MSCDEDGWSTSSVDDCAVIESGLEEDGTSLNETDNEREENGDTTDTDYEKNLDPNILYKLLYKKDHPSIRRSNDRSKDRPKAKSTLFDVEHNYYNGMDNEDGSSSEEDADRIQIPYFNHTENNLWDSSGNASKGNKEENKDCSSNAKNSVEKGKVESKKESNPNSRRQSVDSFFGDMRKMISVDTFDRGSYYSGHKYAFVNIKKHPILCYNACKKKKD